MGDLNFPDQYALGRAMNALVELLQDDAALANWCLNHHHSGLTVIYGNQQTSEITPRDLPGAVVEYGEARLEQEAFHATQYWAQDIVVAFVWATQNIGRALQQRTELLGLLPATIQSNRTLGDTVDSNTLTRLDPDRGINHPTAVLRAYLTINYQTG